MRKGPEIPNVRVKWFGGYYEGVIDGVCECNGKLYFYDSCEEERIVDIDWNTGTVHDLGHIRFYNVRKAKWWQMLSEIISHATFTLLVVRISTRWSMWLWNAVRKPSFDPYQQCEIIGWFVEEPVAVDTTKAPPNAWKIFRRFF